VNGYLAETVEELNLAAVGFRFSTSSFPGLARIPSVVGPFNYFDLRATLSQTMWILRRGGITAPPRRIFEPASSLRGMRDLVVLAVGGAYLQVIAGAARVQSARAQLDTANVLYQQTSQQRGVGLVAQIDVNRSRVQMLSQQQRLVSLVNDLASRRSTWPALPACRPPIGTT